MALLKLVSLSVGSLMLLQGAYAQDQSNPKATLATCLTNLNDARKEVGLTAFNAPGAPKLKEEAGSKSDPTLVEVCKFLQKNHAAPGALKGTAAYNVQADGNCATAVAEWKKGISSFKDYTTSAPPAFAKGDNTDAEQIGGAPFNTAEAVNFAALYSPKSTDAECAFVTCPQLSAGSIAEVKALVCLTYPAALEDKQAPWSKDQWDKIMAVLSPSKPSSASAAVPTLLALAAAAVGVALM